MTDSDPCPLRRRLLGQVDAFRYATAPNAPTYRAIMTVCYEATQRYVVELRPADILGALQASGYVVEVGDIDDLETGYLEQLASWGNLARTADPAGVERLEDYYRRRLVYHLTDVGEAAHRAVVEVEATVGRSGSLQTNMLVKIRDGLMVLAEAAGREPADPDELVRALHDVHTAFETLTHEANRFMTDLGRLVTDDRGAADDARFVAYKRAVLAYISRFVEQLRRLADEIVAGLAAVQAAGVEAIVTTAAQSTDLPDFDGTGAARARWATEQRARWAGVAAWFGGTGTGAGAAHRDEPTVERLAAFAVGAVVTLTRTLARLNDRRGRPVDRTTDFLTLARWFAGCGDDAEAHALWRVAFGLSSARHVHLAEDDPDLTSTRTSWWDADPVAVPIRLRTHGNPSRSGRTPRAADHTEQRRWLAARTRRERAQVDAAIARFDGQALRLSALAEVDANQFDLLLRLLDTALAGPLSAHGVRSVPTADGRLRVTLWPPEDSARCVIATPGGRLDCPDYEVEVTDLATPVVRRRLQEGTA